MKLAEIKNFLVLLISKFKSYHAISYFIFEKENKKKNISNLNTLKKLHSEQMFAEKTNVTLAIVIKMSLFRKV